MQKPNIKDIAELSGLSITTVSRVLNGKAEQYRIGKKSQLKVREAANKLNYIPNHFASNLRTGKSRTLALIIPSLNNPFFAGIASEINTAVRKFNYIIIISDSDENLETEKTELHQLAARNIEGLIIVPCGNQWDHLKDIQDRGIPVICIDRYFEESNIPFISSDNYDGAYNATKYLIGQGHSRIACIQGVQYSTPNKLRVKGFSDAMHEAELQDFIITGDDFTVQNGYLETKLLLQLKEPPTAIFTLSNTIAMGCMKALKEIGYLIPTDISLITFDDHPYLDYLSTPLSSVEQPVKDISLMAVKFILALIQSKTIPQTRVLLRPNIILRESVSTPRKTLNISSKSSIL